jgi:hypothetical protein
MVLAGDFFIFPWHIPILGWLVVSTNPSEKW